MPHTLPAQIGTAAYLVICLYACTRRDREVRLFGVAIALDEFFYLATWRPMSFFSTDLALMALDALLLAAIVVLAWREPRPWLILAGGLQLVCTLAHPVASFDHHVRERALETLLLALGYGVLACLLWAALNADVRRRRALDETAIIEADRAVWRSRGDVDAAWRASGAGVAALRGVARAQAEAVMGELERRRAAKRPSREDVATGKPGGLEGGGRP